MKFKITQTRGYSKTHAPRTVDLTTIDDLLAFIRSENWPVIVSCDGDGDEEEEWSIELYDDYRE